MPPDPETMAQVGLKSFPKWWIDRQTVTLRGAAWRAPEKENPRPGGDPAVPFALPPAPSTASNSREGHRPTRLFGHTLQSPETPPSSSTSSSGASHRQARSLDTELSDHSAATPNSPSPGNTTHQPSPAIRRQSPPAAPIRKLHPPQRTIIVPAVREDISLDGSDHASAGRGTSRTSHAPIRSFMRYMPIRSQAVGTSEGSCQVLAPGNCAAEAAQSTEKTIATRAQRPARQPRNDTSASGFARHGDPRPDITLQANGSSQGHSRAPEASPQLHDQHAGNLMNPAPDPYDCLVDLDDGEP